MRFVMFQVWLGFIWCSVKVAAQCLQSDAVSVYEVCLWIVCLFDVCPCDVSVQCASV